ncbi:hypothetical protein EV424DRAFT_1324198 [Suillus variegatus]|nr:hypothetical protein EV424DRAFT_1324198 [Suillus variegatus]
MVVGPAISLRAVHSRRVPSTGGYGGASLSDHHNIIIVLVGCLSGTVFGGLHCLGWNTLFQGHTEQILWCAASLVIVFIPFLALLSIGYNHSPYDLKDPYYGIIAICCSLFISVYIVARVTLIVLILMSFRSLPPGVYDTVAWTKFIPHL